MNNVKILLILAFIGAGLGCSQTKTQMKEEPSSELSIEAVEASNSVTPQEIPFDPDVIRGTLENGMSYFVKKNSEPLNRAELRLVIKVGSIVEDDDQLGLAHLTEHMAFNGTTNYAKQELVNYLESVGTQFGPDLNAYTSFDETVYMLQVRSDSLEQMETGFDILREWAGEIIMDPEEVDKERGVVIEEWRLGQGAGQRIQNQQFPVIFHGSKYAERLPIGKKEVLENFDHEAIVRFYKDWYRPNLMSLVAVGDFDQDQIESWIKDKFSDLTNPESSRPRQEFSIPDHDETLFGLTTDPEAPQTMVQIMYKHDSSKIVNIEDFRRSTIQSMYDGLINQRLQEYTQKPNPPFMFAYSGLSPFTDSKTFYMMAAMMPEGGDHLQATQILFQEARRAKEFGFTQSELDRLKTQTLRSSERAFQEKDKTDSRRIAGGLVNSALSGRALTSPEFRYSTIRKVVPEIRLEEVNAIASKWIRDKSRIILATAPEKEGVSIPSEAAFNLLLSKVSDLEIKAYEDEVSDAPLLANLPNPGSILTEELEADLDLTRLVLSNEIEVVLKKTDFKNDQILFTASSPGGSSLAPDDDFISAQYASFALSESGLGNFDSIQLKKKLTGKIATARASVGVLEESISGSSSPADLETMFQLIYLNFVEPRKDVDSFAAFKTNYGGFIRGMMNSPEAVFRDSMSIAMSQNHPRSRPLTEDRLNEIDLEKAYAFYKDRFADASDFKFYFIGNLDFDKTKSFIEQYLASLPTLDRQEDWVDTGIRTPSGKIFKEILKGKEPKSQVAIRFTGKVDWSIDARIDMNVLQDALQIKLREVLREDLGGTYGVGVRGFVRKEPHESFQIGIDFGCDPSRVEELIASIQAQLSDLRQNGLSDVYLQKVRETYKSKHEEDLRSNSFWLSALRYIDENNLHASYASEHWGPRINATTPEILKDSANIFLDRTNEAIFILKPEPDTAN